ncbi:hypothetical protein PMAYCL1PPCAC_09115, partial [Pristionchus mayeri]
KTSSTTIRMCTKRRCEMFNKLLCLACALDGGHGGHVVKYDVKMEKVRKELQKEMTNICSKFEEKKLNVVKLSDQVTSMAQTLKRDIVHVQIPLRVLLQVHSLASEQDAKESRNVERTCPNSRG